jgi:hypothetical protein
MMTKDDLPDVVTKTLKALGGTANVVVVAKEIWKQHQSELSNSGDLFFTWQYDMRWAAQKLRDAGKLSHVRENGRSAWQLVRG